LVHSLSLHDALPIFAAGAIARIVGPGGVREAPVEAIPVAPGKTSLQKGEIIASFFLPPRPPRSADAYQRFTPRTEMDIAVVGVRSEEHTSELQSRGQ